MLALGDTDLLLPSRDYDVTDLEGWVNGRIPASSSMPWLTRSWPGSFHLRLARPPCFRPDRPVMLGCYFNPCWGSGRFGYGHFLASTNQVKSIREATWGSDGMGAPAKLALRFDSPDLSVAGEFNTQVTALWYSPLGRVDPSDGSDFENGLYLVTVVDERYFWNFRSYPSTGEAKSEAWSSVIAKCGQAIGKEIKADSVPGAYLKADATIASRAGGNMAIMLDAVAANVGMRVVRTLKGDVLLHNPASATDAHAANTKAWSVLAGGDRFLGQL